MTEKTSRPLHILMTGSEWFSTRPGGLNRYFEKLSLSWPRDFDRVEARAFGNSPDSGLTWGVSGQSLLRRLVSSRRSSRHKYDLLDRHFCLYGPLVITRRRFRLRVQHFHGPWASESEAAGENSLIVRAKYAIERAIYLKTDRFVVLSEYFKEFLAATYGVDRARIEVIRPGVEYPGPLAPVAGPGTKEVLCVRRLERRMGIDILLRAWPTVLERTPGAKLNIAGIGSERESLLALSHQLGLGGSVTFRGRVSDAALSELYARSSVSVVPSTGLEGYGLIALESLVRGTPVVVTDCGGLPEVVTPLDPSLVVPVGDPAALADRLSRALDGETPSVSECVAYAREFTWERSAADHREVYSRWLEEVSVPERPRYRRDNQSALRRHRLPRARDQDTVGPDDAQP